MTAKAARMEFWREILELALDASVVHLNTSASFQLAQRTPGQLGRQALNRLPRTQVGRSRVLKNTMLKSGYSNEP